MFTRSSLLANLGPKGVESESESPPLEFKAGAIDFDDDSDKETAETATPGSSQWTPSRSRGSPSSADSANSGLAKRGAQQFRIEGSPGSSSLY